MRAPAPTQSTTREIGVQSFTYREFDVDGFCEELADTPVTAVELCDVHVSPDSGDEHVDGVLDALGDADLDVCGYGVVDFDGNPEAAEETLAFVDRLGGDYLSVEFPPDDDAVIDALCDGATEHDLDLAIHNHGPDATYATVDEVVTVLDEHPHDRLGACVDTGHYLRSGEHPGEVIPELGDRVYALHLKDFLDEDTEAIPGDGELDVSELLSLLHEHTSFDRPLVVEYEADPDDPTPAVVEASQAVIRSEEE